ncbi:hypothetical protein [Sulfuracidifex metallicus]|uniref:DNA polymerase sliding clamp n=1 Tax=Sulfuracidifex metallicus DSM 6482 = JCM 9184 TaxID=523847 RepID=A0A6A9QT05_SULME|nr:hypothetical protein [Sulfuracidifex metallicus]MUN28282.1 DNA polymerase sliding clamp [Sulfuracidifex metallicus DSM 6482 = JCM 9184]WOE51185.1 DNA polymerase sliding clamp [Sulfuracidifex metallicus DSM 6482 = JCM 9184]
MTFSFVYPSAKDFSSFVSALSKVTDNFVLNITEEGVNGRYVEPDTKSMMIILDIPKTYFSLFEVEKPLSVELNLSSLKKVLLKAKSKTATVEVAETDSGIRITVRDQKVGTKSNIYLASNKGDVNLGAEPKVEHTVKFSLESKVVERIAGDSSVIGEEVTVKGEGEEVMFYTSEEGKEYTAILRKDKPLKYLEVNDIAESKFRIELIKEGIDVVSQFSDVEVNIGSNIPMKLRSEADAGGQFTVWIAPVV